MTGEIAPPLTETLNKYVEETGGDRAKILGQIEEFARRLGTPNQLDFAAWLWVRNQGSQPPALTLSTPFSTIDKPYITMAEALQIAGDNTSFVIRGWLFGYKNIKTKKNTDMVAIGLADESGLRDVLVFGEMVTTLEKLSPALGEVIVCKGAQVFRGDKPEPAISVSGNYASFGKLADPKEMNLPAIRSLPRTNANAIKTYVPALLRVLQTSYNIKKYTGCPQCKSKFKDEVEPGRKAECVGNKKKNRVGCGLVDAVELQIVTIVGFDNTRGVKLSVPIDFHLDEETLKSLNQRWLIVAGDLGKGDDFRVKWFAPEDQLPTPDTATPNTGTPVTPAAPAQTPTTQTVVTPTGEKVTVTTVTVSTPQVSSGMGTPVTIPTTAAPVESTVPLPADLTPYVVKIVDYVTIFEGKQTLEELVDYFKRAKIPVNVGKAAIVEAVTQGKLKQSGTTILVA